MPEQRRSAPRQVEFAARVSAVSDLADDHCLTRSILLQLGHPDTAQFGNVLTP